MKTVEQSADTADYVKHHLQFEVRTSVNAASALLVRLPGTHYLTASSSSRTLVDLNSFSSLIYFALLFDILLAPLDNL